MYRSKSSTGAAWYAVTVSEHYFSSSTVAEPTDVQLLQFSARGHDLQMWVSDRVFSNSRLDAGTRELLLAVPPMPTSGRFLDIGCGWGPVAVSTALESPGAEVWAIDVNPRALALTARNAEVNQAANVTTLPAAEALERCQREGLRFDVILSNPPVRIGKAALREMTLNWLGLLAEGGEAWLVMGKNLGADSFITWLNAQGYVARKHSSRKGYRIIRVTAG